MSTQAKIEKLVDDLLDQAQKRVDLGQVTGVAELLQAATVANRLAYELKGRK